LIRGRAPTSGLKLGDPVQARHLEIRGFHLAEDQTDWSIGALSVEDFDLGRYDPDVHGPNQFVNLAARIAGALTVGRLEQNETLLVEPAARDRMALRKITVSQYDKGTAASIAIAGFEIMPGAAREPIFGIADFSVTNLDLRRMLKSMGAATWRPGMPLGRIDLDLASLSGFGGAGMARYGVSLDRIVSEGRRESQEVRHSSLKVEGLVVAPPPRNIETLQMRMVMQAMGLKELRFNFDCNGTEDRGRSEVSIDRCTLDGADLGDISMSGKLVAADAAFWRAIDEGDTLGLLQTKAGLGGAKLMIADRGLVERTIKAIAMTSGQPATAVRTRLAQEIRRFQPPGILITEDMTKLLDTVARFVESGGILTVEAKPEMPIGIDKMEYFSRPGPDLVTLLGLTATLSK
jgi:hypothetical protein